MAPAWKIGVTITRSGGCPVPMRALLVASTSPGRSVCGGCALRKCSFTASGSVLMNTGMASVHCASALPSASISTVTKSWFSRTIGENAVRPSARSAWSVMNTRRFHSTCRVIGSLKSMVVCLSPG